MRGTWMAALVGLAMMAAGQAMAEATHQVSEKVYPIDGAKALLVENRRGTVTIHAGDEGQIRVTAVKEIRGSSASERQKIDDETRVSAGIENGTMVVRVTYPSSVSVRLNFFDLFHYEMPRSDVRLTIEVPPSLAVALRSSSGDLNTDGLEGTQDFESSSGDIEVTDASGAIKAETSSGNVTLRHVLAASIHSTSGDLRIDDARGPLSLHASSGDITVRGAADSLVIGASSGDVVVERAPRGLRVETGSGDVHVDTASGRVALETSSGDLRVGLRAPLSRVELRTESGEVGARVTGDAGLALDIGTGSGSIEADLPLRVKHASRHALMASVGNGETPFVVRSSSGDIHLMSGGQ